MTGELAVINKEGDTKTIWSSDKPDEVEVARAAFDTFKKKGYRAFSVKGKDGEQDKMVDKFDPAMERIIFIPPISGG
jgi:hypothetical protein